MYRNITTSELEALMKETNVNIIDIRKPSMFQKGHIKESINIPVELLKKTPEKYLTKSKEYILICQSGVNSEYSGRLLSQLGYRIVNVVGGYHAWLGPIVK